MLTYMYKRIIIFTNFHKKLDTHPSLFTQKNVCKSLSSIYMLLNYAFLYFAWIALPQFFY